MVNSCSAVGCKNKNTKGCNLTFHRFPLNNKNLLKLWLYQLKRGTWEPSKYSVLCSGHFTEDCFVVKGAQNRRTLKNDAYPTIFSIKNLTESGKKRKSPKARNQAEDVQMSEDEAAEEEKAVPEQNQSNSEENEASDA